MNDDDDRLNLIGQEGFVRQTEDTDGSGCEQDVAAGAVERPTAVLVCSDMMLSIRLADAVRGSGGRGVVVNANDASDAADRLCPVLMLIDLAVEGDWLEAIRRMKLRPHTRQIPIYAFGSHVNTESLRAAREAGADHAWARSRMMEQLVPVLQRYIDPPVRYLEGWDDVLSEHACAAVVEFNRGEYYEQHELFEQAWMEERRPIRAMYQGILQVGLAFYQIERGSWQGAIKMFGRGLPKLRALPGVCQTIKVGELLRRSEEIRSEIVQLGPDRIAEFDRERFPKIERTC